MSKLREKLAEIKSLEDGTFLDTDTGEILDKNPEEEKSDNLDDKLKNIMFEEKETAFDKYHDPKYLNKWDKVSPFNILFCDNINEICSMSPAQAKETIVNVIEALNNTYGGDKTYDYVSKEYLATLKFKLSKLKSINKIIEYLTNIYFKGNESVASINSRELFNFELDLFDKTQVSKAIFTLQTLLELKK